MDVYRTLSILRSDCEAKYSYGLMLARPNNSCENVIVDIQKPEMYRGQFMRRVFCTPGSIYSRRILRRVRQPDSDPASFGCRINAEMKIGVPRYQRWWLFGESKCGARRTTYTRSGSAEARWATSRGQTAMRFWDVVDRNMAILMVEVVSRDAARIPTTEERESRSTFSLLAAFFSLSSNLRFFLFLSPIR